MAWLTNKKTGARFNTDWLDADEKKKYQQINANQAQASSKNIEISNSGLGKQALTLEQKKQLIDDFVKRTGVDVNIMNLPSMPDDTLQMTLDTVATHLKEFGKDNFSITEIRMREDDFTSPDYENSYAYISVDGELCINPKYFTNSVADINAVYQEDVADKYHPKGGVSSILIHELGHARWNYVMAEMVAKYGGDIDELKAMYSDCSNNSWRYGEDLDLYNKKRAYYQLSEKLYDFYERIRTSDYIKSKNNGEESLLSLRLLATPERNYDDAISKYASKNIHEMMAEAWSDVIANEDNASYMSKEVVQEFLHVNIDLYI